MQMRKDVPITIHPDCPNYDNPLHVDDYIEKIPYFLGAAGSEPLTLNFGEALILGGSEGVGMAFAEHLAAAGFALALVARRPAPLEATAAAIRARYGVAVACHALDLASPDATDRLAALVADIDPGLVIYNAGGHEGRRLVRDQPVERALNLVRLNCMSTVAAAHAALPPMRARGRGGLILVSSMSAMAGGGYAATYAATKSFDLILAESLRWEMRRFGVDVMCAVLGLT